MALQEKAFEVLGSNYAKDVINSDDSWVKTSFKRPVVEQGETRGQFSALELHFGTLPVATCLLHIMNEKLAKAGLGRLFL